MIKSLRKLFRLEQNNNSSGSISKLERYKINCTSCQELISFKRLKPLSSSQCPNCNSTFLVPYQIDNYWLTSLLGSGGEGEVYKAIKNTSPPHNYAIKLLHRESRKEKKDSLIREATVLEHFESKKHILQICEYGYYKYQAYYVTELIEASELEQYITEQKPCEEEVLFLCFQIMKTEATILQHGYLYRDLKPDNILVGHDGQITIVDFGICCSATDYLEIEENYIAGTAQYLPPERLTGEIEEERSEIYSLGLILYFMLKGEALINDSNKQKMADKHLQAKNAQWIRQGLATHNPKLVDILCKMTAFKKADRYLTMKEAESELKRYFNQTYRNIRHKTHS